MARKKFYTLQDKEPAVVVPELSPVEVVALVEAIAPVQRTPRAAFDDLRTVVAEIPEWDALTPQERAGFEEAVQSLAAGRAPVTIFDHLFLEN